MTFEDFLKKKKIDPVQLEMTERDLFSEFESDFNKMGDKSFEYSKKFWFNKLRRAHPLKEEPKSVKGEDTSSSKTAPEPSKSVESIPSANASSNPKPLFKPRFKAQIPATNAEESTDKKESSNPVPPPAFKPRFRAAAPVIREEENEVKTESAAKPTGFKPRFKASAIPSAVKSESAETVKTIATENQTEPVTDSSTVQTETPAEKEPAPKPAYKPRFKPSMIKKDPEE